MGKSNMAELKEDLKKEFDGLLAEHCGNCDINSVCNTCFPRFIDLALRRQREALKKDVEEILKRDLKDDKKGNLIRDNYIVPIDYIHGLLKEIKQLLK